MLNASVEGEEIVYHDDVNLGIAVALDDGLIVPVIPKAQRLSLEGMAAAIADVAAARGRSGWSRMRCTAARSRSATPGNSGPCSRRRSSTSRRSRSSTSRRSSSERWSSTDRTVTRSGSGR